MRKKARLEEIEISSTFSEDEEQNKNPPPPEKIPSVLKNIKNFQPRFPKPTDKLNQFKSDNITNYHIMIWYYKASELMCEESLNTLLYVSEEPLQRYPLATAFLALIHSENVHFPNILNREKAIAIADLVYPYLLDNITKVLIHDIYQQYLTNKHQPKEAITKISYYNSLDSEYYAQILSKVEDFDEESFKISPPTQEELELCMYSEYILGHFYEKGLLSHCSSENTYEAYFWYLSSANRGFFLAQLATGYLLEYGCAGVEIDLDKAIKLYEESGKQGDATALYNLGIFHDTGKVFEKDDEKALSYYIESAQQGYDKAELQIGNYYNEVLLDYKESMKWYKLSAMKENPEAQFCIGLLYFYGRGVKKNYLEAKKYFEKSADNPILPDSEAQYYLSRCYLEGLGCNVDLAEAKKWAKRSLENGEEKAQNILDRLKKK